MNSTENRAQGPRPRTDVRHQRRLARERMLRRRRRVGLLLTLTLVVLASAGAAWAFARPAPAAPAAASRVAVASSVDLTTPAVASFRAYAKEIAKPVAPPKPAGPKPLAEAPGVKTIVVDKGDQVVTLYSPDGNPVDSFPCASGNLYPRVGTYKVYSRKPASMSTYDNSRFYHFVIFTKSDKGTNIGFHSIPIDTSGAEIGGLGKPISHGCVRLAHEKADFVYGWAKNGTKVVVQK